MKKKKKKIKKKIKKLERDIKRITGCQRNLVLRGVDNAKHIKSCKDAITKLENDNKYYKEWMDRSGVDYKSWFNFEEKTCDTCRWKPLSEQGGQDIPCMGCTGGDLRMWKSKEDEINGN